MKGKLLLGILAAGICLAQSDPALRLGPFHSLPKPGAIEALVELPDGVSAQAPEFQLLEDGRRTSHATSLMPFRNSPWKVALILALDVSRSLKMQELDEVKSATIGFVTQLKDPVLLIAFADSADTLTTFETPRQGLIDAISQLQPTGRRTRLYDALDKALGQLENRPAPERQRIIVISDGSEDSQAGADSIDGVLLRAEKRRVTIDTIWMPTAAAGARNTLVRVSERTEGLHADAKQSPEILAALRRVLDRIDKAVVVSFERKIDDSGPMTKEVGISINRQGISSASMPLQVAASAQERSWYEMFQSLMGFLSNIQTLLSLFGGALAIFGLYTASYLVVKKYYGSHINLFPVNPIFFIRTPTVAPPVAPNGGNIVKSSSAKKGGRHTMVEQGPDVAPAGGLVLQAVKGPLEGQRIPIESEHFQIGADPDSDLALTSDDFVSGRHAVIRGSEGRWILIDQGSRNGTFVEGQKVERGATQVLLHGQLIQIGTSEFRVMLGEDPRAKQAATSSEPVR